MKKLTLASASPRRIEMMRKHGFQPEVIPANIDEKLPMTMNPAASVMYLALKKAQFVESILRKNYLNKYEHCINDNNLSRSIISADTVVVYANKIIGKPGDEKEAFEILSALRNSCHHVITGVCIAEIDISCPSSSKTICFHDDTSVFFKDYSDEELLAYVRTSEPYDKAGGYAIQGTFGRYIDHIDGDLDNVIGFPWHLIEPYLRE